MFFGDVFDMVGLEALLASAGAVARVADPLRNRLAARKP
jgi:hypothetical protein